VFAFWCVGVRWATAAAIGSRRPERILTPESPRAHTSLIGGLQALGGDVEGVLERARVPAYVIDRTGIIRWVNPAAQRLVGDVRGRHLTSVLAPEEKRRGQEIFMRNLLGPPEGSDNRGVFLNAEGKRMEAEVSAVPLESGGHVIGVFGQIVDVDEDTPLPAHPHLTPRQHEVLRLLEQGRSTAQIAGELHISTETARNHIRRLFRALGVHSRLEAVAVARRDAPATAPE
jgi:PAS domain S-box-containing protein